MKRIREYNNYSDSFICNCPECLECSSFCTNPARKKRKIQMRKSPSLPVEIWSKIHENLDANDLLSMSRVNYQQRNLIHVSYPLSSLLQQLQNRKEYENLDLFVGATALIQSFGKQTKKSEAWWRLMLFFVIEAVPRIANDRFLKECILFYNDISSRFFSKQTILEASYSELHFRFLPIVVYRCDLSLFENISTVEGSSEIFNYKLNIGRPGFSLTVDLMTENFAKILDHLAELAGLESCNDFSEIAARDLSSSTKVNIANYISRFRTRYCSLKTVQILARWLEDLKSIERKSIRKSVTEWLILIMQAPCFSCDYKMRCFAYATEHKYFSSVIFKKCTIYLDVSIVLHLLDRQIYYLEEILAIQTNISSLNHNIPAPEQIYFRWTQIFRKLLNSSLSQERLLKFVVTESTNLSLIAAAIPFIDLNQLFRIPEENLLRILPTLTEAKPELEPFLKRLANHLSLPPSGISNIWNRNIHADMLNHVLMNYNLYFPSCFDLVIEIMIDLFDGSARGKFWIILLRKHRYYHSNFHISKFLRYASSQLNILFHRGLALDFTPSEIERIFNLPR